jgi:NADPH-dependent 2,4-dienoyl-CoA reductase/sulfur reductase-like enzyme
MTTCCSASAMPSGTQSYPVAIIGAGPVGLAAAAHLVSRGERPVGLEAGPTVSAHIAGWGHVQGEQVRSVAAALVGDIEAARRVEPTLPETGVCSSPAAGQGGTDTAPASCCVTEPVVVAATLSAPGRR